MTVNSGAVLCYVVNVGFWKYRWLRIVSFKQYITQRLYVKRNYTETQNVSRKLMDYYFGICNSFVIEVRIVFGLLQDVI